MTCAQPVIEVDLQYELEVATIIIIIITIIIIIITHHELLYRSRSTGWPCSTAMYRQVHTCVAVFITCFL